MIYQYLTKTSGSNLKSLPDQKWFPPPSDPLPPEASYHTLFSTVGYRFMCHIFPTRLQTLSSGNVSSTCLHLPLVPGYFIVHTYAYLKVPIDNISQRSYNDGPLLAIAAGHPSTITNK